MNTGLENMTPHSTPPFHRNHSIPSSCSNSHAALTGGVTPMASEANRVDAPLFVVHQVGNTGSVHGGEIGTPQHQDFQQDSMSISSSAVSPNTTNLHVGTLPSHDDAHAKGSKIMKGRANSVPSRKHQLQARLSHISSMVESSQDEAQLQEVERILDQLQSLMAMSLTQSTKTASSVDGVCN